MAEVQFRFRDDEPVADPGVTVDAFGEQSNAAAVRLEPGDEARDLLPHLDRIRLVEVNFPVFGDGRGYSSARILREAGFTGDIRAIGDLTVDQLVYLKRAGFSSVAADRPIDAEVAARALARFPFVYQRATDDAQPAWALRHGGAAK